MRGTVREAVVGNGALGQRHYLVGIMVCSLFLAGCKSMPTKQDFQNSVQAMSDGIKSGVSRIKVKGPSNSSKKSNNTMLIVGKYPLGQVPHTLMKKPVAEGKLTSGHGYRFSPTGVPIPKKHKGVDYSAPTGTPVYAAGNGTIVKHYTSKSYGNYIRIEHENEFFTAYAHMQAFAEGLGEGSTVTKGQLIGNVGSTGRSSGPHLHYEMIYKSTFIDPLFRFTPVPEQVALE